MLTLYIMKNAQRDRERLENLWRSLSLQDREWLRRRLLPADDEQTGAARPALSVTECRAAERWFEERCAGARTVRDRQARLRLWLLFLLLRYGGLRLVEALSLRPEDWDWQRDCLHVRGRPDRLVPLPLPLGRPCMTAWKTPPFWPRWPPCPATAASSAVPLPSAAGPAVSPPGCCPPAACVTTARGNCGGTDSLPRWWMPSWDAAGTRTPRLRRA